MHRCRHPRRTPQARSGGRCRSSCAACATDRRAGGSPSPSTRATGRGRRAASNRRQAGERGRTGRSCRNFQVVGTAEERTELPCLDVVVGVHETRERGIAGDDGDLRGVRELLERPAIDVGDGVAEPIDDEDRAASVSPSTTGTGMSRRWYSCTGRPSAAIWTPRASQPAAGANRSRPSNVRLTVGRAYCAFCDLHDLARRQRAQGFGQQPVVGRHEPVVARVDGDAARACFRRPDPRPRGI